MSWTKQKYFVAEIVGIFRACISGSMGLDGEAKVCQGQGHGGKDKASVATPDVNWTQTVGSEQVLFGNP